MNKSSVKTLRPRIRIWKIVEGLKNVNIGAAILLTDAGEDSQRVSSFITTLLLKLSNPIGHRSDHVARRFTS